MESTEMYKKLVDDLYLIARNAIIARSVRHGYSGEKTVLNSDPSFQVLLEDMTTEQRNCLANAIHRVYLEGIRNVITYLSNQITQDQLRIIMDGIELPKEPFGASMVEEWDLKLDGVGWPKRSDHSTE